MRREIHYGDVGTILRVTVKDQDGEVIDLTHQTMIKFTFRRPNGTVFDKTASLYTDGSDGVVQYTVEDGVLNATGEWKYQIAFTLSAPAGTWHSNIVSFQVMSNLS